MNETCPYCGSKGKKKPHTRIMEKEKAKEGSWYDLACGSCGRGFRSY